MKHVLLMALPALIGIGAAAPALADRSGVDRAKYGLSCSPAEVLDHVSWIDVPLSSERINWAKAGDDSLICIAAAPNQKPRLRGFAHSSAHHYTDLMVYTEHGRRKLFMAHVAASGDVDIQDVELLSDARAASKD